MNTPTHLLMGAAVFGRKSDDKTTMAAIAGAMIPDLAMYLMIGWAIFVQGHSAHYVFDTLYFSDSWQAVFAVDNSFVLWGALLLVAWCSRCSWAIAGCGAALLHILTDFLLHHDDARRHFWPVSDWVFESPVSYWDRAHFGDIVGPIETALCAGMLVYLLIQFRKLGYRIGFALLGAAAILPVFMWRFIF